MGVQGDLGTLELPDLLQNLELHRKSGLLTVDARGDVASFYFDEGRLTLFATADRAPLLEVLVGAGRIEADAVERARKRRRKSRKSLGQVLVEMEEIEEQDLVELARARLLGDACERIVSSDGEFTFTPGGVPRGVFDPEERRLGLALPVGPLLLEAARREDHWHMIRARIPSDSAHFRRARRQQPSADPAAPTLGEALLARLDGTLSVGEVVAPFPHQRFEAYQELAALAEQGTIRMVGPSDLAQLASELEPLEPGRAWDLVTRGLGRDPQNVELLSVSARLADARGDEERAVDALKMLAHLHSEAGRGDEACEALARAAHIAPADTAIAQRRLDLALESALDGALDEALAVGLELVELYRAPGLHRKAALVLEELLRRDPASWTVRRELARARADAGDLTGALAGLERFARAELAAERYAAAREAFAAMLELDPSLAAVERQIAEIDSGAAARRRERRRRLAQRSLAVGTLVLATTLFAVESAARRDWARADRAIVEGGLLVEGRVDEARALLEEVRRAHPLAPTTWFDVAQRVRVLEGLGRD